MCLHEEQNDYMNQESAEAGQACRPQNKVLQAPNLATHTFHPLSSHTKPRNSPTERLPWEALRWYDVKLLHLCVTAAPCIYTPPLTGEAALGTSPRSAE